MKNPSFPEAAKEIFTRWSWNNTLNDTVKLLVGARPERFAFETVIRLFEFQTWIYFPGTNIPSAAAMMAAALLLNRLEEDIYFDEESEMSQQRFGSLEEQPMTNLNDKPDSTLGRISVLRANTQYRQLHDYLFAKHGGLMTLLCCPSPDYFDNGVAKRREEAQRIVDLVEYRLRWAQHGSVDQPQNLNARHAVVFKWRPTHHIKGKRGATSEGKSLSPKRLNYWWKPFQATAIFIYLNENHGYSQIPEIGNFRLDGSKNIEDAARDIEVIRRFFGAYAYIAETIHAKGGEKPLIEVPLSIQRVEVATKTFTPAELKVIGDYDTNHFEMDYT